MSNVAIRPLEMVDVPWVRALYGDFLSERPSTYPTFTSDDLDHFVLVVAQALRQDETFHGEVAVVDGRVVGFILCNLTRRFIGQPALVMVPHVLYVHVDHRGQGISRLLSRDVIAWYREHHPEVNEIEIYARNGDPQWIDRGFEPFLLVVHGSFALADRYITGGTKEPQEHLNGPDAVQVED